MTDKLREVLALAEEIGGAWRGDWSNFDGRTLRHQMEELRRVAEGDISAREYRFIHELCPAGFGHWTDYCEERCHEVPGGSVVREENASNG